MSGMWHVRCSCVDEDGVRRTWSESCFDCAEATATAHRALGHTVTVKRPSLDWVSKPSKTTQQLTGKKAGW